MKEARFSFAARVPNWLGDAVLALPAVRGLVACSGRSRVLILASPCAAAVFSRLPGTAVLEVARAGGGSLDSLRTVVRGSGILRRHKPVLVFSFTKSFTSALMCRLGRVPRRIGFGDAAGSGLYTDRVGPYRVPGRHHVDAYCRLVESMGFTVTDRTPALEPAEGDVAEGDNVLERSNLGPGAYLCLFPGARYGPSKRWDADRFGLLGDTLADRLGLATVLLGSAEDAEACGVVEKTMRTRCVNLCGKTTFGVLLGILVRSRAVVANDSGGMHLAASVGVPTVGLFFSTDPGWTAPRGSRARAIYNPPGCSPCFRRDCDRGHECTRAIDVPGVAEAVIDLTGEGP